MMNPTCSIVIRAFNEAKHLGKLFEGIANQTVKDIEVILVDSGSSDDTVAIAEKNDASIVHIPPQEFTFGRSLNKGIAAANGQFILVCSAHVYPVYPDWIEKILEPFQDPEIALVYGKQRGTPQSHFSEQQIFKHWYLEESHIPQDHPFCNNANAAIRRALWEQRKYDEALTGLEDLEWAQWAFDQQHKIAYVADATVIHVHQESSKSIKNRYMREGMAFKHIYPQETFTMTDLVRLVTKNVLSDYAAAFAEKRIRNECLNILCFRWMQFYGTYVGYRRSGQLTWNLRQSFYYPRNHVHRIANETNRTVKPIDYTESKR